MKHYKCLSEECTDAVGIYRFKGLCRSCTEYDESGNVVTPVQRSEVDQYGNLIVKMEPRPMTLAEEMGTAKPITRKDKQRVANYFKNLQKEKTRARKARQAAVREAALEKTHVHTEDCNHEGEFTELATSEEE